jgi:hypothetical protein
MTDQTILDRLDRIEQALRLLMAARYASIDTEGAELGAIMEAWAHTLPDDDDDDEDGDEEPREEPSEKDLSEQE